jgi:hypothetical protein
MRNIDGAFGVPSSLQVNAMETTTGDGVAGSVKFVAT